MNTCIAKSSSGVKKGAWTEEEDVLLRKCIEKYGEGKWHQVPLRAGLNRCKKSCRLRWLNYLRPDIKRGDFSFDEVDLILRLHKLLGNRWSLIAGRLPGRTANDIKNYWNNHLRKKLIAPHEKKESKQKAKKIIKLRPRPRPRTFSWTITYVKSNTNTVDKDIEGSKEIIRFNEKSKPTTQEWTDDGTQWWANLLANNYNNNGIIEEADNSSTTLLHEEMPHFS